MPEERWYRARQLLPGAILCCTHGTSRICKCVRYFNIDKNDLMTEQEVAVATATFELNRMERLGIDDKEKYDLLCDIIQSQQGKEDLYIEAYEQLYGPLPPKRTIEIPGPDQQPLPLETDPQLLSTNCNVRPPSPESEQLNFSQILLIIVLCLSIILAVFLATIVGVDSNSKK